MFGAEILFEQGKIRDYIEDDVEDNLLRVAVAYHSAYRLPEDLDDRTRMFCQILRDGDKIDILKVNVEFSLEEIYNVSTRELRTSKVSKEVMEAFKEGHAVLRSLKKTPVDNVVGHISLVYELVYPRSLALVKEQGYVKKLMTNVLRYEMEDGTSLIVRPSGTEPKVKVYSLANGTSKEDCDAKVAKDAAWAESLKG